MSKLQELKQKIKTLRPGIKIKLKNCPDCGEEIGYDRSNKLYFCGNCSNGFNGLDIDYLVRNNIRPITLDDVLSILNEQYNNSDCLASCHHQQQARVEHSFSILEIVELWSPNKPLDDQSEETINLLHSLIVK